MSWYSFVVVVEGRWRALWPATHGDFACCFGSLEWMEKAQRGKVKGMSRWCPDDTLRIAVSRWCVLRPGRQHKGKPTSLNLENNHDGSDHLLSMKHVTEFDQIQVICVSGLEGATSSGSELFSWKFKFIHKQIVEDWRCNLWNINFELVKFSSSATDAGGYDTLLRCLCCSMVVQLSASRCIPPVSPGHHDIQCIRIAELDSTGQCCPNCMGQLYSLDHGLPIFGSGSGHCCSGDLIILRPRFNESTCFLWNHQRSYSVCFTFAAQLNPSMSFQVVSSKK